MVYLQQYNLFYEAIGVIQARSLKRKRPHILKQQEMKVKTPGKMKKAFFASFSKKGRSKQISPFLQLSQEHIFYLLA